MRAQYLSPLCGFWRAQVGAAVTSAGKSVGQGPLVQVGEQMEPGTPMMEKASSSGSQPSLGGP